MNRSDLLMLSLVSALVAGCAEPTPNRTSPDAPIQTVDAPASVSMLPTWALEDLQPASPRVGQTYGLDVFTGRIIVVSLLEGF
jgi:hypothetical protein